MSRDEDEKRIVEIARGIGRAVDEELCVATVVTDVLVRRLGYAIDEARELIFREVIDVVKGHKCRSKSCDCAGEIALDLNVQRVSSPVYLYRLWEQMR